MIAADQVAGQIGGTGDWLPMYTVLPLTTWMWASNAAVLRLLADRRLHERAGSNQHHDHTTNHNAPQVDTRCPAR